MTNIGPGAKIGAGVNIKILPPPPDGLTAQRAGTSAWQIKQDYPASTDGLYWIKNDNINAGQPVQIYADMTTLGGGWTLLVQSTGYLNPYELWNNQTVLERNTSSPPATLETYNNLLGFPNGMDSTKNYSILGWADYIKKNVSGGQATFDYMIDAGYREHNGAAYTANENYSFVANYDSSSMGDAMLGGAGFRKNITEISHFPAGAPGDSATWQYGAASVEARMPYVALLGNPWFPGGNMFLGTNGSDGSWWGTIISLQQFSPAPWFGGGITGSVSIDLQNPRVIWYWVR